MELETEKSSKMSCQSRILCRQENRGKQGQTLYTKLVMASYDQLLLSTEIDN